MTNILVVEDDYEQAQYIERVLKKRFPSIQVKQVRTEYEFQSMHEDLKKTPPDIVLIDVMLRWTDPSPNMAPVPEDVKAEGFYRAGLRCERLLRQTAETKMVPVILYTVLEHTDLKDELRNNTSNTFYVEKYSDPSYLLGIINQVINARAS